MLPTEMSTLAEMPIGIEYGPLILQFRERYAGLFNAMTLERSDVAQEEIRALIKDVPILGARTKTFYYNFFILAQTYEPGDSYADIEAKVFKTYVSDSLIGDEPITCCCGKNNVKWAGHVKLKRGYLLLGSECILKYRFADKETLARDKKPKTCIECKVPIKTSKFARKCHTCNMKRKTATCKCGRLFDPRFGTCYGCRTAV